MGRTVLFVSHNLAAVRSLSDTGVLLDQGRLVAYGKLADVLEVYDQKLSLAQEIFFRQVGDRPSITRVAVNASELVNGNLIVEVDFAASFPLRPPMVGLLVTTAQGTPVFSCNPRLHQANVPLESHPSGTLQIRVDGLPLRNGTYHISVWLGDWQIDYEHRPNVLAFEFGSRGFNGSSLAPDDAGFIEWPSNWELIESVHEERYLAPADAGGI